jgi:hypothetical protein
MRRITTYLPCGLYAGRCSSLPNYRNPFNKYITCKPKFYSKFIRLIRRILNKATRCLGWKQLFISFDVFSGLVTFVALFDKLSPDLWCKSLLDRLLTAERFATRGTPVDSRTFVCGSSVEIRTFYVFWLASCSQNVASSLARLFYCRTCHVSWFTYSSLSRNSSGRYRILCDGCFTIFTLTPTVAL